MNQNKINELTKSFEIQILLTSVSLSQVSIKFINFLTLKGITFCNRQYDKTKRWRPKRAKMSPSSKFLLPFLCFPYSTYLQISKIGVRFTKHLLPLRCRNKLIQIALELVSWKKNCEYSISYCITYWNCQNFVLENVVSNISLKSRRT